MEERGGRAQAARCCARAESLHLMGKTLSDLRARFTMVSGLREAPSAPAWVPPRVPLWPVGALVFPRVAVVSQGRAGCPGPAVPLVTGLAGRGWTSAGPQSRMRWLEANCSSIVRASALPLACCPLPYEWRPLRPSGKGFTPKSGLCLWTDQQQATA